ncbi:MAG: response regulator transcription factor [Clostridia bacterium]|nr:MAG: response regulator transcription factor [Clostridia bacterium]
MAKILVVEDEAPIVELLRFNLEKEGYRVIIAYDGHEALNKLRENPDLVLLDLMLPGLDGMEICRRIRGDAATSRLPVIMLTARSQEADKVLGLETGADDYITKPFSPRELVARVKAILRRATMEASPELEVIRAGPITLRPGRYEVYVGDRRQDLTPKEFELLRHLVLNAGKVLNRDYLLDKVWGYDYIADTRTVDVHIRYLRQKIEADPSNPQLIETVRGVGYRFRELA